MQTTTKSGRRVLLAIALCALAATALGIAQADAIASDGASPGHEAGIAAPWKRMGPFGGDFDGAGGSGGFGFGFGGSGGFDGIGGAGGSGGSSPLQRSPLHPLPAYR